MSRLNKKAAELMQNYKIGGCTDITGFGLKGHCLNLVNAQKHEISFKIHKLPILNKTDIINKNVLDFQLLDGYSAETSGGLLVIINPRDSESYLKDLLRNDQWGWIIGQVKEGNRTVDIAENAIIEYATDCNSSKPKF